MSGVPVDQELGFTDRLIGSNFSNYSSWHYRSTLLPLLHPESPEPPSPCREPPQSSPPPSPPTHSHRVCEEQLLKGKLKTKASRDPQGCVFSNSSYGLNLTCSMLPFVEYELVKNAFFTDPNDQSAWFYYRWLLGRGL